MRCQAKSPPEISTRAASAPIQPRGFGANRLGEFRNGFGRKAGSSSFGAGLNDPASVEAGADRAPAKTAPADNSPAGEIRMGLCGVFCGGIWGEPPRDISGEISGEPSCPFCGARFCRARSCNRCFNAAGADSPLQTRFTAALRRGSSKFSSTFIFQCGLPLISRDLTAISRKNAASYKEPSAASGYSRIKPSLCA